MLGFWLKLEHLALLDDPEVVALIFRSPLPGGEIQQISALNSVMEDILLRWI